MEPIDAVSNIFSDLFSNIIWILIAGVVVYRIILGSIAIDIANKKGYKNLSTYFLLGFLLGLIGIIYAVGLPTLDELLCRISFKNSQKDFYLTADQIKLLKDLGEIKLNGVIFKCEDLNLEILNDKYQSLICNVTINNESE